VLQPNAGLATADKRGVSASPGCWNYKVMGSQRRYLEGLIDDRDDADDEY